MPMKASEIREAFLAFFEERGHRRVASSPVVPLEDPTLLFTNAGMNQFKDDLLGKRDQGFRRAASSQKCIRAGGKHNDLENVGYTARHQTFFEMLGNFSFGDYFKKDAIAFAWDFLTGTLKLPPERLWPTIYKEDDEAAELWKKTARINDSRITRLGEKDNFWAMGDTGPCGPCSEIIFDRGKPPCGPSCGIGRCDCDRWLEIWNLVFMQFERGADGKLVPLPMQSIDTGMGLERISSVIQDVDTNYETDLFTPIIGAISKRVGRPYSPGPEGVPFRVVADHLRALSFAIADGAMPSNEGRGFVLRRILRRASRYGRMMEVQGPFIHELVPVLSAEMGKAFPELADRGRRKHIEQVIRAEEESFGRTLDRGIEHFERIASALKKGEDFPGSEAFFLHDTCGFPVDLTALMARERGLGIDQAGFEGLMEEQRERARASSSFQAAESDPSINLQVHEPTRFDPDESQRPEVYRLQYKGARLLAGFGGREEGADAILLLETTIFYPEGGGQVGDQGFIQTEDKGFRFHVENTTKREGRVLHHGKILGGSLPRPNTPLVLTVDFLDREPVMRAHTATHLLHRALHETLGEHAVQQGSLVEPDRLRFDFAHAQAVSAADLEKIETRVNELIVENLPRHTKLMSLDAARKLGAMALFGEKYGATVRLVYIGEEEELPESAVSRELCGGTHVERTGDIGFFWIAKEGSVASGVRRIEALTGAAAVAAAQDERRRFRQAAAILGGDPSQLADRIEALRKELKDLKKGLAKSAAGDLNAEAARLWEGAITIDGARVIAAAIEGADADALRQLADLLRSRGPSVAFLASSKEGKALLVAAASKDLAARGAHAGELVKVAAPLVGGGGGGRPDLAQAGGKDPSGIPAALEAARAKALAQLASGKTTR